MPPGGLSPLPSNGPVAPNDLGACPAAAAQHHAAHPRLALQEYARQRTEADRAAFVDHIRVKQHVEQVRQNAVAVRNEIQAQRKEGG